MSQARLMVGASPETGMLELWGGHECTINRVGDVYRDQSEETGHDARGVEDLERFAALNIRSLRYPVLWEKVAPESFDKCDWRLADERLEQIRTLGMKPIVGLVHHGSGPRHTSLVSDNFAPLLGQYARAVAERYPWVEDWTPVNEPLTTARFSCLYGHWYPHAMDERQFWLALLNQVDGVRFAMREIRQVNPAARLVQTEDLGEVFATPAMQAEADFQNHRRWSTWDLLQGRVTPEHPLFDRIAGFGLGDRLRAMADEPCRVDVLGVNYYPTSIRFLDERRERYPQWNNGETGHIDMDALRVLSPHPMDLKGLLRQTWDRYETPLAVTESHCGCTREEQMRWTFEAWRDGLELRRDGVDLRAITAWALLGNYDWSSLITRQAKSYEPGAFDLRGPTVRPSAMTDMLRRLGGGERLDDITKAHPVLRNRGWWRRDVRLEHAPYSCQPDLAHMPDPDHFHGEPILITGATGVLGQALAGACALRGLPHVLTSRAELDLSKDGGIAQALDRIRPWAVINAAGWVRVDEAESHEAACMAANADGAAALARACAERDLPCVSFSSDLVFDGTLDRAYVESDAPAPLNAYGRSKAEAERLIAQAGGRQLVIRTAAFFSPYDPHNFAARVARELSAGRTVPASSDHVVTPTYTPDLARHTLDLLIDGETGLRHLSSGEALSWFDFAVRVAAALDLEAGRILPATPRRLGWAARRPINAALGTELGQIMPSFDDALARFAQVYRSRRDASAASQIAA